MAIQNPWPKTIAAAILALASISSRAQVNVTTWHNDLARTGVNNLETILTATNVNVSQFGKLFQIQVDGQVYAQPLVLSGVEIGGGTHNVVYVATEHDSVYALDADNGTIYAQVSLIPSGGATVNANSDLVPACGDITPEVGITGTPVIDPASNTLYVVAKSKVNGSIVQHLHALNTVTLAENFGSPVEIQATVPGSANDGDGTHVTFNPTTELQRPALALDKGHVLIAWASHCDHTPYHGWVMSYNAQTLAQEAAWNATPNGDPNGTLTLGGIWMAGAAPAVDADGNFYVVTGNGYENGATDFGNSVVKLGLPVNGTLPVLDYFNPFNQSGTNTIGDQDLGSGGVLLLPTASNGAQLLAQAGKAGNLRLLDRNNLGKNCILLSTPCTNSDTQIPQELLGAGGLVFSTPNVWNGRIFWISNGKPVVAYSLDANGLMSATPVSQTAATFSLRDAASISANSSSNGIFWIMHNTGELFAYDATDLTRILWSSGQAGNRDANGGSTKFAAPTIANGKVYIGNSENSPNVGSLVAYGLLTTKATTPTFSPGAGTYSGSQTVTISDATPNATFFFTTNGTTPTTASTQYTGPITVSASETLQAIAIANGLDNSDVGSASYNITSSGGGTPTTAAPTFSPPAGTYTGTKSVTIADATSGATIYFTTNGSTPTTASTVYTGPISVSASETLQAIAVASGANPSAVASAAYTINTSGGGGTNPPAVNDPNGFPDATGFTFLNGATVAGGALQLTDGGSFENRVVWYTTPVNVQSFTTDFSFQITPATPNASDGFTFTIQNKGLNANGGIGGALGYQGITPSVAVKFDTFNNDGEGVNSTGFYTNGAAPTVPSLDLTPSGVNLHSGDIMHAHLTYDGATLTLTLTDTVTGASFNASQAINIPNTVGGNTAFVGFTAGTGGTVSTQNILNWTYTPAPSPPTTAQPAFSPAAGTYTGAQSVTISDSSPGATIYFTTDGSAPTTSSSVYSGPIIVSANETLRAIAVAPSDAPSTIVSAAYTINTASSGGGTVLVSYANGFASGTGFTFLGGPTVTGGALQLTDGGNFENRAAWYGTPVSVLSFTTDFSFQITPASPNASDGFTFTMQNMGLNADGGIGGALAYQSITRSVAVKFDTFSNAGEGVNSTGFYTNGAAPTVPALDLTPSGVDLHSGDVMHAHLTYDGATLTLTLTDTVTGAMFTGSRAIDIPGTVGGNTAFVGFTAGTGGTVSTQSILTWTYAAN